MNDKNNYFLPTERYLYQCGFAHWINQPVQQFSYTMNTAFGSGLK